MVAVRLATVYAHGDLGGGPRRVLHLEETRRED
jgi:hypothetical protein